MFFDPGVSEELFTVWENTFLEMLRGEMALNVFNNILADYYHDAALEILLAYLAKHYSQDEIDILMEEDPTYQRYRPVIHYFVGYRIFREIHDRNGYEGFLAAIADPRSLLAAYRALSTVDLSLPQISSEMEEAWSGL